MKHKKLEIGTLILAILLTCMALVPAVSAEELAKNRNDTDTGYIEELVEEEPTITLNIMPKHTYWFLLEADEEERKILFGYIDNCDISDEKKKEMKKAMKDIWSRYPDQITDEDNLTLEETDTATAKYLSGKYGNDDIGTK
jgi:hypothetical protein